MKIRASDLKSHGGILAWSLILLLEMAGSSPWEVASEIEVYVQVYCKVLLEEEEDKAWSA